MSTRLSLVLLAMAFGLLCAIVLLTLPSPAKAPVEDARQQRDETGPLPFLPAGRTVPQRGCFGLFPGECDASPAIRPAATRR